jgi:uncharacterized membrane protein YciS (DUF1049 family)
VSRKWLIALLLLLLFLLTAVVWQYRDNVITAVNWFLSLDKDGLETLEKQLAIVGIVLAPMWAGVIWLISRLWSRATPGGENTSAQREAESRYLQGLLREYELPQVEEAYTSQAADFQQNAHLPERWFRAELRYEQHQRAGEPNEAQTPPEHHENLLEAFEKHQRLVLLGEPGMGKSFSLWRITAEYANHALKNARKPIPVVIPLNEWIEKDQTLHAFVLQQMRGLAPFYEALYRQQRLLPLLDALNEVPFAQRDIKLEQVKAFIKQQQDFPRLLLTCRKRDYTDELAQNLDRLIIEPLTPPRIHDFLRNYFRHVFRKGEDAVKIADTLFWQLTGGEPMQQAWEQWQTHKPDWKTRLHHLLERGYTPPTWENFWKLEEPQGWYWKNYWDRSRLAHLNNPRSLLELAKNPYLLSMIAKIFHKEGKLPESKRSLFEHFVGVLWEREQGEKNRVPDDIPPRLQLENKLKLLAWELQSRGEGMDEVRTTLLRSEAVQILPLAWLAFSHAANLLEITGDKVRFSHQLLQEFFTAQHFAKKRRSGLKASEIWAAERWWVANGWEEAVKLAVEYEADPRDFLQWLAEGQPKLAAEIAREQGLLDDTLFAEFRTQWQTAITDIEHYPNPHERHAISTVLAWLDWDNRPGLGIDDIDWVEIPAGEFTYQDGECLSLPTYKMSRYPVTNTQFQAFVVDGGYENDEWWEGLQKPEAIHESWWKESNRPVEEVDWYESIAFCRWLSAKTGQEIRLPTEQEWEKAARGTDGREYPWGNEFESGRCNAEYKLQETSAVGIYPQGQSPYGLMDMSGNVWEWCLNQYGKPEVIEPDLAGVGRVVRGGSWSFKGGGCRSAIRLRNGPGDRIFNLGFRLALGHASAG